MKKILLALAAALVFVTARAQDAPPPVRLAIIGLVHDHAYGFIPRLKGRRDVVLAGIVEPDHALTARYAARFHLAPTLFYDSLNDLLAHTNIQAVAVFTSTFDHRRTVEMCAPHGLDVMMEKPLSVNMKDARAIAAAAAKYHIQIVVNYETTWYPSSQAAWQIVHQNQIGGIRKVVVCDGHPGPKEIGCSQDFLRWLTDPVLDGGGALPDFGCYGADLVTWLMDGARPLSVFAVTRHIKPKIYPKVEDDAVVVVTYPKAEAILQASWNWPFSRKDMEVYGQTGYVLAPNGDTILVRKSKEAETKIELPPLQGPDADPVSYLAAVVRKEIEPAGLSSLKVNLIVMEILDAAKKSARTGRSIKLH